MNAEERLKAAGWRPTCDRKWPWTRDGKMWFTEDEALVVVLTAERDAAIARAERAEAERDDANGRRDLVCAAMLMVGCELAGDPKIDPRNRRDARHTPTLLLAAEVRARAEAAEALAASRPDVSPELAFAWLCELPGGPSTSAIHAALRAHAQMGES